MVMINPEIIAGEALASKLKDYFFFEEAWSPNLTFAVGRKMSELKRKARVFYPELDAIAFLHKLGSYTKKDMEEVFAMEGICNENRVGNIGGLTISSMALK